MSVIMEQAAELYNYLFVTLKGLQPDEGKICKRFKVSFSRRSPLGELLSDQRLSDARSDDFHFVHFTLQIWTETHGISKTIQPQICHDCIQPFAGFREFIFYH